MHSILITGSGTGVGKATAMALAKKRAFRLFLTGRRSHLLEETKEQILADCMKGTEVHIITADHSTEEGQSAITNTIGANTDSLEVMINNAGKLILAPATQLTMQDYLDVYKVNVFGVALLAGRLHPWLKRGKLKADVASHVVNISSMGGIQGSMKFSGLSAYSSSKGAVLTLTECLAEEWSEERIRVNALAIGSVDTEMFRVAFPGVEAATEAGSMGSFIAQFAIEHASLVNGKILPISSGTP